MTVRSALGWVARTVWSSGSRTGFVGPPRLPNRASRAAHPVRRGRAGAGGPVPRRRSRASSVDAGSLARAHHGDDVGISTSRPASRSRAARGRPARRAPRRPTTLAAGLLEQAGRRPRRCHRSPGRRRRRAPARPRRRRRACTSMVGRCRTRGRRSGPSRSPGSLPALRTGTKPMPSSWASAAPKMKPRASMPATTSTLPRRRSAMSRMTAAKASGSASSGVTSLKTTPAREVRDVPQRGSATTRRAGAACRRHRAASALATWAGAWAGCAVRWRGRVLVRRRGRWRRHRRRPARSAAPAAPSAAASSSTTSSLDGVGGDVVRRRRRRGAPGGAAASLLEVLDRWPRGCAGARGAAWR